MGVEVEVMDFGFRADRRPGPRRRRGCVADRDHAIKAVLAVQTDTASSVRNDVAALRAALDAAGHPALLAVDCIACLACDRFEMDAWGVDVMVAACQKGLMTPPGLAFTFHGPRAEAARVACPSPYWDWGPRTRPEVYYQLFCGTAPTHHLYGLRCALDMILKEEGLEAVWTRHARLRPRGLGGGRGLGRRRRARAQHRRAPAAQPRGDDDPHRARRRRAAAALVRRGAGLTLGIGLSVPGVDPEGLFRIGHMGHLNPPMLLGTLATIEAGLRAPRDPARHRRGRGRGGGDRGRRQRRAGRRQRDGDRGRDRLGAVDTYRIHRTMAAIVTTARKFLAVFSYRVATRRNCLSLEKQHSIRDRIA